MTILNTLRTALRGILANKLRAALTSLGVIIGVASVIATLALGNGARAMVEAKFRFLGSNDIQISEKQAIEDGELVPFGKPLSYEDGLEMPKTLASIERVQMSVSGSAKVRRGRVVLDMTINGNTADALTDVVEMGEAQPVDWPAGKPLDPAEFIGLGRIYTPVEVLNTANVCVLGYQTAEDLFQGDNPIGETIQVNRQRFLVIGVLAELEPTDPEERYNTQINEGLYMPISTAIKNLYDSEPSVFITAKVKEESKMEDTKKEVMNYLRARHDVSINSDGEYEDDFFVMTRQDIIGAQQEAAGTLSTLLVALAVVSLAVGGIGIMNVMLVSVSERTREIGICMAIGARQRDIVAQFLLEAILLSAASGLAGIAVGMFVVPVAARFNQGMALLDPASIPLAFSVAVLTGALFGLYPALRASRLLPIEALRYE